MVSGVVAHVIWTILPFTHKELSLQSVLHIKTLALVPRASVQTLSTMVSFSGSKAGSIGLEEENLPQVKSIKHLDRGPDGMLVMKVCLGAETVLLGLSHSLKW